MEIISLGRHKKDFPTMSLATVYKIFLLIKSLGEVLLMPYQHVA